jgi:GTP-binding protein HflX
LEEVKTADILLHVLDASSEKIHEQDEAVYKVLKELEAGNKIIINVLNKIDLAPNQEYKKRLKKDFRNPVFVSALTGDGIAALVDEISELLSGLVSEIKIEIPNNRMDKINLIYESGKVIFREDRAESVYLEAVIPARLKYII